MSRKTEFEAIKALFENQLQIPDRTFQDFNGLITRANTQRLRLSDQDRAELHQIYKRHKLSLLDQIIHGNGGKEYPIKEMFEVIKGACNDLKVSGRPTLSKEEIVRIYTAVVDAELQHRDQKPEKIRGVAGMELDKVVAERRGQH